MSSSLDGNAISEENIEYLKAEFLRLHRMMMDGRDATTKLTAVAQVLNAEGIAFPETVPAVVMEKGPEAEPIRLFQRKPA